MKILLQDAAPVQRNCNRFPRPLFREIKSYVEDLLDRGWRVSSQSNYSSPVVVV